MLRRLKDKLSSPLLQQKLLVGAFLPLVFFVPLLMLVVFWPGEEGAIVWKVMALTLTPASLFGLWVLYLYFVAQISDQERQLDKWK